MARGPTGQAEARARAEPGAGAAAPPWPSPTRRASSRSACASSASALGVEAMSLYNHVANKGELLDGMVDLVFGEIDMPADDARLEGGDAAARHVGTCRPRRATPGRSA